MYFSSLWSCPSFFGTTTFTSTLSRSCLYSTLSLSLRSFRLNSIFFDFFLSFSRDRDFEFDPLLLLLRRDSFSFFSGLMRSRSRSIASFFSRSRRSRYARSFSSRSLSSRSFSFSSYSASISPSYSLAYCCGDGFPPTAVTYSWGSVGCASSSRSGKEFLNCCARFSLMDLPLCRMGPPFLKH